MGQCRTLENIECYYGDYGSCDNTFPYVTFYLEDIFSLTFVATGESEGYKLVGEIATLLQLCITCCHYSHANTTL